MYTVQSFNSQDAFQDFLNGVILGRPLANPTMGLHGLTLIVTPDGASPVTVTFADATGAGLSPRAILDAITTASSGALAGKVVLRNYGYANSANPCLAITAIAAYVSGSGTANAILGFADADKTVTEIGSADIQSIIVNPTGPLYTVVTHT